jgi:hypothetical protein
MLFVPFFSSLIYSFGFISICFLVVQLIVIGVQECQYRVDKDAKNEHKALTKGFKEKLKAEEGADPKVVDAVSNHQFESQIQVSALTH